MTCLIVWCIMAGSLLIGGREGVGNIFRLERREDDDNDGADDDCDAGSSIKRGWRFWMKAIASSWWTSQPLTTASTHVGPKMWAALWTVPIIFSSMLKVSLPSTPPPPPQPFCEKNMPLTFGLGFRLITFRFPVGILRIIFYESARTPKRPGRLTCSISVWDTDGYDEDDEIMSTSFRNGLLLLQVNRTSK